MPITFKFFVQYAYFGKDEEIFKLKDEMENWDLEKIYKEHLECKISSLVQNDQ
jgi:hypothetical protein